MLTDKPTPELTARTPLQHLEGMPPYLMMQVEARLKVRIRETLGLDMGRERVDDLARDLLRRMMAQRMRDGKQFDSILEASRKAFAKAMFMQQLGKAGAA